MKWLAVDGDLIRRDERVGVFVDDGVPRVLWDDAVAPVPLAWDDRTVVPTGRTLGWRSRERAQLALALALTAGAPPAGPCVEERLLRPPLAGSSADFDLAVPCRSCGRPAWSELRVYPGDGKAPMTADFCAHCGALALFLAGCSGLLLVRRG